MNSVDPGELWEIEVGGTIYAAGFEDLTSWIAEGSLQPEDKIRRRNLRWIAAGKVPALAPLFDFKAAASAVAPRSQSVANPNVPGGADGPESAASAVEIIRKYDAGERAKRVGPADSRQQDESEFCVNHATAAAIYFCGSCGENFCKACPNSYGGSVKICTRCGALCQSIEKSRGAEAAAAQKTAALAAGFGVRDFLISLAAPLRFRSGLVFGAALFAVFSIGQSAVALGGILMTAAAVFCAMLANTLAFGVLARTIGNFVRGEFDESFMPDFDDFSLWETVVHPFLLSTGALVSSFGAFALVMIVGVSLIANTVDSKSSAIRAELSKIPGTRYYALKDTAKQSEEVQDLLSDVQRQNARRLQAQQSVEAAAANSVLEQKPELPDSQAAQDKPSAAFDAASDEREILRAALGLPPPLVVLGVLALLWGLFYFPSACAVAGYSRTFSAAINPLVGLDTIRRLGINYAKILLMSAPLLFAVAVVGSVSSTAFSAFDIPWIGNLPAKLVMSIFGFYVWAVFSYVVGMGLFKSTDRLPLEN